MAAVCSSTPWIARRQPARSAISPRRTSTGWGSRGPLMRTPRWTRSSTARATASSVSVTFPSTGCGLPPRCAERSEASRDLIRSVTPLDDIFVLDLSRILSGPFCTMMLGDMGATVVKVEPPPRGDDTRLWGPPFVNGISTYFLSINRNKRSIGLNLKSPQGQEVLWKLVDRADVLVENFRPGVLDKLGFGYDAVSARNPRIVYASISGYGQTGPYRNRPGYDVVAQGESGIVDLTGEPDRQPVKVGASIADIVAGLYAYQGILLALLARQRSGKGQRIDIAVLDGMVSTLTYQAMSYLATGKSPRRLGTRHPSIVPYETFETKDGFVNVGAANEKQWQNFCRALGFPDLAFDARFSTMAGRIKNYDELGAILGAEMKK